MWLRLKTCKSEEYIRICKQKYQQTITWTQKKNIISDWSTMNSQHDETPILHGLNTMIYRHLTNGSTDCCNVIQRFWKNMSTVNLMKIAHFAPLEYLIGMYVKQIAVQFRHLWQFRITFSIIISGKSKHFHWINHSCSRMDNSCNGVIFHKWIAHFKWYWH